MLVFSLHFWCLSGSALIGSKASARADEENSCPDVESNWEVAGREEPSLQTSGTLVFSACIDHHSKFFLSLQVFFITVLWWLIWLLFLIENVKYTYEYEQSKIKIMWPQTRIKMYQANGWFYELQPDIKRKIKHSSKNIIMKNYSRKLKKYPMSLQQ